MTFQWLVLRFTRRSHARDTSAWNVTPLKALIRRFTKIGNLWTCHTCAASDLRDTTERHYSRLLARMDAFERSMEEVKEKIVAQGLNSNSCIPEPANSTSFFDGFSSSPYYEPLAVVNPPLQVPNSHQYMFPLQDMTNKHPRTEDSGQNVIPEEVIMQAMQCCKSRRNLAGRLCNKIFPEAARQQVIVEEF